MVELYLKADVTVMSNSTISFHFILRFPLHMHTRFLSVVGCKLLLSQLKLCGELVVAPLLQTYSATLEIREVVALLLHNSMPQRRMHSEKKGD